MTAAHVSVLRRRCSSCLKTTLFGTGVPLCNEQPGEQIALLQHVLAAARSAGGAWAGGGAGTRGPHGEAHLVHASATFHGS